MIAKRGYRSGEAAMRGITFPASRVLWPPLPGAVGPIAGRREGDAPAFGCGLQKPGAFLIAQPHHVFLDGNFFVGHDSSPSRDRDGADSDNAIKRNDVSHQ